jgi:hypothetical protein
MNTQTCSTCAAWRAGECRRHAPRSGGVGYSDRDYPRIHTPPDYWCFEHHPPPIRDVTEDALGRYRAALVTIAAGGAVDPAGAAREALRGEVG